MIEIPGHGGRYSLTSDGRVWSNKRLFDGTRKSAGWHLTGRWIRPYKKENGYLQVGLLTDDKKRKYYLIHRLVGSLFVKGEDIGLVINHIDENKTNNNYTNLEWCTVKENRQAYIANHPITGENNPNYKDGRSFKK